MKKLFLILPFLIVACNKDAPADSLSKNSDSATVNVTTNTGTNAPVVDQDSLIANSSAVERVLDEGINRNVKQNEIVRTADASMFPFTIGDQFTEDDQKFILKITNVTKPQLKITVESEKPMNIRINQIKKPDGSFDGPFGKTLNFDTKEKGDYWIILGKSQMASGNSKGHFDIKVQ